MCYVLVEQTLEPFHLFLVTKNGTFISREKNGLVIMKKKTILLAKASTLPRKLCYAFDAAKRHYLLMRFSANYSVALRPQFKTRTEKILLPPS